MFAVLLALLMLGLLLAWLGGRRRRPVVRFEDRVVGHVLSTHVDEHGVTVDIEITDPVLAAEMADSGSAYLSLSPDPDTTVELVARDDDEGVDRG